MLDYLGIVHEQGSIPESGDITEEKILDRMQKAFFNFGFMDFRRQQIADAYQSDNTMQAPLD